MNKARRQEIETLCQKIRNATTNDEIQAFMGELENIKAEEEDYFDNMPENFQGSMRGMDSEDAIASMEDALDMLNDAMEEIGEARVTLLEDAIDLLGEI